MLLIYCDDITPRIAYIFQYMLQRLCGLDYTITTDEETYRLHTSTTLNYSAKQLKEDDREIKPNGLLFLQKIVPCEAIIKKEKENVYLFLKGEGIDASVFDPFAAAFFLISRYEEYLPFTPDAFGRFEAAASLLFKHQLLYRPLINEWAAMLKQTFSKTHIALPLKKNTFTCVVTIDVDQAFAFRHRGFLKNGLAFAKNVLHWNTAYLKSQVKTLTSTSNDPYDTFDYLQQIQKATGLPFIYFINAGTPTAFDKNEPLSNAPFKKLLNRLKQHAQIGLHPSYFSDTIPEKTAQEKQTLEAALNQPVTQSRQHYLKLYFPQTYRQLLALSITEDYTMGYASHPGFRAGTCTPFFWFDLEQNIATPLLVFPITYMEGSFGEDLAVRPQTALAEMKTLIDTVQLYQGCLIPIWHNHSVNDQFFWKGWRTVFEESLHYLIKKKL